MIQVESKLSLYGGIAMDERCEACGGELMEGKLAGMHGMQFYPAGEFEKLLNPKRSAVVCYCCKSCGLIQKLRATEVDKLW